MKSSRKVAWQPIAIGAGVLALFIVSGGAVYLVNKAEQEKRAASSPGIDLSLNIDRVINTEPIIQKRVTEQNTMTLERLSETIQEQGYAFDGAGLSSPVALATLRSLLSERYFSHEVKKSPTGQAYLLPWKRYGHLALPTSFYERLTERTNSFSDGDTSRGFGLTMTSESSPYVVSLSVVDPEIASNAYYQGFVDECFKTEEVDLSVNPSGYSAKVLCPEVGYAFKTKAYANSWFEESSASTLRVASPTIIAPTSTVQFYDQIVDRGMGNAEAYFQVNQGNLVKRIVHVSYALKPGQTLTDAIKDKILADIKAIQKSMAEESERACAYDFYGGCY